MLVISRQYRTLYGVDLATELENRIVGSVGSLLAGACMHKVLAEVMYIYRAGKSNRKYETLRKKDTALEVLCEVKLKRMGEDYARCYVGHRNSGQRTRTMGLWIMDHGPWIKEGREEQKYTC